MRDTRPRDVVRVTAVGRNRDARAGSSAQGRLLALCAKGPHTHAQCDAGDALWAWCGHLVW